MRSWILGLAVFAGLAAPATSSADLPDIDVRSDRDAAYAGSNDGLLTGRSSATPERIALDHARDAFGLTADDIASLKLVARAVSPDGITHLRYNQVALRDRVLRLRPGRARHARRPPDHQHRRRSSAAPGCPTPALRSAPSRASARRATRRTGSPFRRASAKSGRDHDLRHRRGGEAALGRHRQGRAPRVGRLRRGRGLVVRRARRRRVGRHARPQGPHRAHRRRPLLPARPGHVARHADHDAALLVRPEQQRHAAVGPVLAHLHRPQRPGPRSGRRRRAARASRSRRARPGSRDWLYTRTLFPARRVVPGRRLRVGPHDRGLADDQPVPGGDQRPRARRPLLGVPRPGRRSASTRRRATSSASTRAAPGSATTTSAPRSTTARASTTPTSRRRPTATRRACRCTCSRAAT